jgi:hypothetical protein
MSISLQQTRAIIRKAIKRVPEGEAITHLNIMPMMDMMTMLLVAFIFQVATGAEAIQAASVQLPDSVFQEEMPEALRSGIITDKAIVIEGKVVSWCATATATPRPGRRRRRPADPLRSSSCRHARREHDAKPGSRARSRRLRPS